MPILQMAREYLQTETEMAYLDKYLQDLSSRLGEAEEQEQEVFQLNREKVLKLNPFKLGIQIRDTFSKGQSSTG